MPLQGEEGLICLSDSTQIVCDGQTNMPASQDCPLLSFLPGHPDTTYLSLLIIIIDLSFFLTFPVDFAIIDIKQDGHELNNDCVC